MSMESKTHSYNNTCITYNNLELTLPNDLKFIDAKIKFRATQSQVVNVKAGLSH